MDAIPGHRIFIVNDLPLLTEGLQAVIHSVDDLCVCGIASSVPEAIREISVADPDLILSDIQLAGGTGLDLTKRLKAKNDAVRVILVSLYDESLYADRGIRAGAMGYVNKCATRDDLLAAIRCVLDGRIYLSELMEQRTLSKLVGGETTLQSPLEQLTDRELEVFQLVSEGATVRDIANQISLSVKTIDTYRENIKSKLGINSARELIRFAVEWRIGEVF